MKKIYCDVCGREVSREEQLEKDGFCGYKDGILGIEVCRNCLWIFKNIHKRYEERIKRNIKKIKEETKEAK